MKIQSIEAKRLTQLYWLSPQEAENKEIAGFLHNAFSLQKEQGVLPVIVESGNGELKESLYLLMKRQAEAGKSAFEKAS